MRVDVNGALRLKWFKLHPIKKILGKTRTPSTVLYCGYPKKLKNRRAQRDGGLLTLLQI